MREGRGGMKEEGETREGRTRNGRGALSYILERGGTRKGKNVSALTFLENTDPEELGAKVAREILSELKHGGCTDEYLSDQIIIFMALAEGTCLWRTEGRGG
jgi:RNA 3'-terminal phosphate cyclase